VWRGRAGRHALRQKNLCDPERNAQGGKKTVRKLANEKKNVRREKIDFWPETVLGGGGGGGEKIMYYSNLEKKGGGIGRGERI